MNNIIEKIQNHHLIKKINPYINEEAYIVGGFLRDFFLGKDS